MEIKRRREASVNARHPRAKDRRRRRAVCRGNICRWTHGHVLNQSRHDRRSLSPRHSIFPPTISGSIPWDAQAARLCLACAQRSHRANHAEIIASAGTARLMQARLGGQRREHVLEFGERRAFRDFAHHAPARRPHLRLGAGLHRKRRRLAALHGRFQAAARPFRRADGVAPRRDADHGDDLRPAEISACRRPRRSSRRWSPFAARRSRKARCRCCSATRSAKSQEILCALLAAGLTPMLHGAVFRMTEIYRQLRPDFPDGYVRYAAGQVAGKVLVCPPSANRSLMITRIKNRRVAVLTGWALDPGATFRYQCDAAFPAHRSRGLPGPRPLRGTGAAAARAHAARLRARLRARSARARLRGVGAERGKPARACARGTIQRPSATPEVGVRAEPMPEAPRSRRSHPELRAPSRDVGEQTRRDHEQAEEDRNCSAAILRSLDARRSCRSPRATSPAGLCAKRSAHAAGRLGGDQARAPRGRAASASSSCARSRGCTPTPARPPTKRCSTRTTPRAIFARANPREFFDALQRARGPLAKGGAAPAAARRLSPRSKAVTSCASSPAICASA